MQMIKKFFAENKTGLAMLLLAALFEAALRIGFGIRAPAVELAAVAFGIVSLDLSRRQKVSNFFFNIAFCIILILWFAQIGLYGQIVMRSFMIMTSMFGIYFWLRPDEFKKLIRPTHLNAESRLVLYGGILAATVILFLQFGAIKTMDYMAAAMIIIGAVLLTRKKIDVWFLYFMADTVSVFLFVSTGEYAYLAFLGCAIYNEIRSIREWGGEIKERKKNVRNIGR